VVVPAVAEPRLRRQEYCDWANEVVDQVRGVNPKRERAVERLPRQRP